MLESVGYTPVKLIIGAPKLLHKGKSGFHKLSRSSSSRFMTKSFIILPILLINEVNKCTYYGFVLLAIRVINTLNLNG